MIGAYSTWLVEAGVLVAAVGVVTGVLGRDWGLPVLALVVVVGVVIGV